MTNILELRGGLLVREDAVLLLLDLEARQHVLTERDGALLVTNGASLTEQDKVAIRELKPHLIACVRYVAPEPV